MTKIIEIEFFEDVKGFCPFEDWVTDLDKQMQQRIDARLERISISGNLGDHKHINGGVYELRFHFGSGYRIYYGKKDNKIILLLCGGDKKSQKKDIKKAQEYWEFYENNS